MVVQFEKNIIKSWSNDLPILCISGEEVKNANRNDLNDIIKIYIQGIKTAGVTESNKDFISISTYFAMKMWNSKFPGGRFLIGSVVINELLNIYDNSPLRVAEIAYETKDKELHKIYYAQSIENVVTHDNMKFFDPSYFTCVYNLISPMLTLDISKEN